MRRFFAASRWQHGEAELGEHPMRSRFVRQHEDWLNRALRTGRPSARIPTRRVADGGFAAVMKGDKGRTWAASWWIEALESTD